MKHTLEIAWIAIRELLYEKVFYILLSFAGLALALSVLLGQLTYGEQAKLTLDFMLAGIEISMVLFSIFMGISLFQRELTLGSVSMVLSKPISRTSFLLGKYLGQVTVQLGVIVAMTCVTALACLRFDAINYAAICQAVGFIFLEVCVLTAATYLFSVNAGAITAALASFALFVAGHFNSGSGRTPASESPNPLLQVLLSFIPNLEVFNLKTLASYGLGLSNKEITIGLAYAILCTGMFLLMAIITFNRKDIYT